MAEIFKKSVTELSENELCGYYVFLRAVPIDILPEDLYESVLTEITQRKIDSLIIPLEYPKNLTEKTPEIQKHTYTYQNQFLHEFYEELLIETETIKTATEEQKLATREVARLEKRVTSAEVALEKAKHRTREKNVQLSTFIQEKQEDLNNEKTPALRRRQTLQNQVEKLLEKEQLASGKYEDFREQLEAEKQKLKNAEAVLHSKVNTSK